MIVNGYIIEISEQEEKRRRYEYEQEQADRAYEDKVFDEIVGE